MKFKNFATIAVIVVMLLATLVYLATKGGTPATEQPSTEEVQP